ncbi:unnamed protein product [Pieris brassicae]|uniref:Uncharacterized protein n=1 Tax=Pieris brassicae TaxID=7116 RepID=A0A9P0XEW4_PIEBR|nr:unnamed protein product [Pieris brassicae]
MTHDDKKRWKIRGRRGFVFQGNSSRTRVRSLFFVEVAFCASVCKGCTFDGLPALFSCYSNQLRINLKYEGHRRGYILPPGSICSFG